MEIAKTFDPSRAAGVAKASPALEPQAESPVAVSNPDSGPVSQYPNLPAGTGWVESVPRFEDVREAQRLVTEMQSLTAKKMGNAVRRGFHATTIATATGSLKVLEGIPNSIRENLPFRAGDVLPVDFHFSYGASTPKPDNGVGQTGIGAKVKFANGHVWNLSGASSEVFLKDISEVNIAMRANLEVATNWSWAPQWLQTMARIAKIVWNMPWGRKLAPLGFFKSAANQKTGSLVDTTFFSGGPIALGDSKNGSPIAVKYELQPKKKMDFAAPAQAQGLRDDLQKRADQQDVVYVLGVRVFKSEKETPINDASVEWKNATPFVPIAELRVENLSDKDEEKRISQQRFNPASAPPGVQLLSIAKARAEVYAVSSENRDAY